MHVFHTHAPHPARLPGFVKPVKPSMKPPHKMSPPRPRNPLFGKPTMRGVPMSFSDLGSVDWGAIIGTAAQAYTGQPNALSTPKTVVQNYAPSPAPAYGPPSPPPAPASTPYYKNPLVIGIAGVTVLGLGYVLFRGRRNRR